MITHRDGIIIRAANTTTIINIATIHTADAKRAAPIVGRLATRTIRHRNAITDERTTIDAMSAIIVTAVGVANRHDEVVRTIDAALAADRHIRQCQ